MKPYLSQQSEDYKRVEKAIQFIEANFQSQPTLEQIADSVYLSKYHFDRIFKRWAGISPMQFLQFLTLDYAKQKLLEPQSLLHTSLEAGLSGPSRLHDLFVTFEAMTPGQFKQQGAGLNISCGLHDTPFGTCLAALTERGICHLGFVEEDKKAKAISQLRETWPGAEFNESPETVGPVIEGIFRADQVKTARPFNLCVKGTNFQIKVWQALVTIPRGCLVSYQDVAAHIGHAQAYRAVANAVAANPIAFLIPCHRVISHSGKFHKYRWGSARKKALIGWEAAKTC